MSEEEDSDEEDEHFAIVMDNGSLTTKIGFAGDDTPRTFETVIGSKVIDGKTKSYIGRKLGTHKLDEDIILKYPFQNGICTDFDALEKIWHHAFYNELRIVPEEKNVMLTEPALNDKTNREKYTQILFETFNTPAMYIAIQAVLGLYASGRTTGIVIDSGYTKTEVVPVYEGYALPHATLKCQYGGKMITEHLKASLLKNNHEMNKFNIHFDDFRLLKQTYGYIALEPNKEIKKNVCEQPKHVISGYLRSIDNKYIDYTSLEVENKCEEYCGDFNDFLITKKPYKLPDGSTVYVGHEQHDCTELLFNPSLVGIEDMGIGGKVVECVRKNNIDVRGELFHNVVLCGGNTMFKGFGCRLHKEIVATVRGFYNGKIKIIAESEKKYAQWIGGSIMTSLSTFSDMWISKDEYDSCGPGIVHRKCF